ncbi:DUF2934 domain-containing protein [Shinella sp. BYT-45]|uniref:DUF2934 domain-containing protein n=1 Tax=Shinella sp. BYT-45 TaxID=3377377 RepID=UPI00397EE925
MDDERQEWISKRAYVLWEAEGRPQGKDREHWEQAERERAELERVALPEHFRKKRNSDEADAATRRAVDLTRDTLSEGSVEKPSVRRAAGPSKASAVPPRPALS